MSKTEGKVPLNKEEKNENPGRKREMYDSAEI